MRARSAAWLLALIALAGCEADMPRPEGPGEPRARPLTVPAALRPGGHTDLAAPRTEILRGRLEVVRDEGGAVRVAYDGGTGNGYSRAVYDVRWRDGREIRYGARLRLPEGFRDAMGGQVAIIRWDNYGANPGATERGGLAIWGADKRARLFRGKDGIDQEPITRGFPLPEGRWVRLEVRQVLSAASTVNEVFLDGRRVASSDRPNTYGHDVDRLRVGIDAIDAGAQTEPLELLVDYVWAVDRSA